jgi:hypothetical protein
MFSFGLVEIMAVLALVMPEQFSFWAPGILYICTENGTQYSGCAPAMILGQTFRMNNFCGHFWIQRMGFTRG